MKASRLFAALTLSVAMLTTPISAQQHRSAVSSRNSNSGQKVETPKRESATANRGSSSALRNDNRGSNVRPGNDNRNNLLAQIACHIYHVPHVFARFDDANIGKLVEDLPIRAIFPFTLSLSEFEKDYDFLFGEED